MFNKLDEAVQRTLNAHDLQVSQLKNQVEMLMTMMERLLEPPTRPGFRFQIGAAEHATDILSVCDPNSIIPAALYDDAKNELLLEVMSLKAQASMTPELLEKLATRLETNEIVE